MTSSHTKRYFRLMLLGVITVIAAVLRFVSVAETQIDTPIRADAAQYTAYAYNLRENGVYSHDTQILLGDHDHSPTPDALRPPGYPLFLYLYAGEKKLEFFYKKSVFTQALLSIFLIPITYILFSAMLGPATGLAVAGLTALSPHLITANSYILSETLFSFLFLAGITVIGLCNSGQWKNLLLSGILLAYAMLVKPTVWYYTIPLLSLLYICHRHTLQGMAIIVAPMVLIVGGWLLRNWLMLGYFSDPTLTISTLHHGMYPDFMYQGREESFGFPYRYDPESNAISQSMQTVLAAIAERFHDNTWTELSWYLRKPLYLFQWDIIAGQGDVFVYPASQSPYYGNAWFMVSHRLMSILHQPLIWLSFIGCVAVWLPSHITRLNGRSEFIARLVSMTYLYFIFVHLAGAPFPRYSVPIRPLSYGLALFAGYLAYTWIRYYWITRVNANNSA